MSGSPSNWLELSVEAPPEFVEPLSQIFLRYGNGGVAVEEEGGYRPDEGEVPGQRRATIRTFMPLDASAAERRGRIDVAVRLVAALAPMSDLAERVLPEEQWRDAWKKHFKPLKIGRRVVVRPTWSAGRPADGEATIWLDPGMAFGTGHHPTTRMCIEQIERTMTPGARVLDVGFGSGILSIAAALLGASEVFGLDIDPAAVGVAEQNGRKNGVESRLTFAAGSLPSPRVRPRSFDLTVANISAKVVSEIASELVASLKPGGVLIASGVLVENSERVQRALSDAGAAITCTTTEDGWVDAGRVGMKSSRTHPNPLQIVALLIP